MAPNIPSFSTRPAGRVDPMGPPTQGPTFDELFTRLAEARLRYEDLRSQPAPLPDRLNARIALEGIRVEIARFRREPV